MTKGSTLESNRYFLLLKQQMSVPNNGLNEAETTLKIDLESKHIIEDFLGCNKTYWVGHQKCFVLLLGLFVVYIMETFKEGTEIYY